MPKKEQGQDNLDFFEKKADEIEVRKEQLRLEREFRKKEQSIKRKRQRQEKMIAPLLFFITLIVSFLIYILSR